MNASAMFADRVATGDGQNMLIKAAFYGTEKHETEVKYAKKCANNTKLFSPNVDHLRERPTSPTTLAVPRDKEIVPFFSQSGSIICQLVPESESGLSPKNKS